MRFFSPAKINLFLRILGRRTDGYHELATLIHTVTLGDLLEVSVAREDALFCDHPLFPRDRSNLIWKAVELFRAKTGWNPPLAFHVTKRIPFEAGLGGGSSNAATALFALNQLSGLNVAEEQLAQWGALIGSDVPCFFSHGGSYCTGRGEVVEEVELPERALSIVKPPFGLSSAAVYATLRTLPLPSGPDPRELLSQAMFGNILCINDLLKPAAQLVPELAEREGHLSGSGSALFHFGERSSEEGEVYSVHFLRRRPGEWYQPLD